MTKKTILSLTIILLSLSISFCGKKEEPKEEVKQETKQTEATGSDLSAKIKAYEDFVTKFCALSEKMKSASVAEKATMSAEFAKDSGNLKTLETDLDAAKASPDEKARIAAASKKASECAKVAAGAGGNSTSPAKNIELPAKTPSIPGMK